MTSDSSKLRHGAPAENRDETEKRIAGVMRAFAGRLTVVNDEIVVSGDLAFVRGSLNITLTPRVGGEPDTDPVSDPARAAVHPSLPGA